MNRPNNEDRLWNELKAQIIEARTPKPKVVTYAHAMQTIRDRAIVTTPDAELDYSAYLSDTFLSNRDNNQNK